MSANNLSTLRGIAEEELVADAVAFCAKHRQVRKGGRFRQGTAVFRMGSLEYFPSEDRQSGVGQSLVIRDARAEKILRFTWWIHDHDAG